MSPDDYLRQRLEHHLADIEGKDELIALLLPLLAMGVRQSAAVWQGLRQEVAQAVAQSLKDDADRHWRISWDGTLERANQIIVVGEARGDLAIQALGTMAKADAIKVVTGRLEEAWELLEYTGRLYRMSHLPENEREIGWARTRIGRVYICAEVGKIEQGFAEAEQAREILEREGEWGRLVSLFGAWGSAFIAMQDYEPAIVPFQHALAIAQEYPDIGGALIPSLYNNLAIAEQGCGRIDQALELFKEAEAVCVARGETAGIAVTRYNVGALYLETGNFREALQVFFEVEPICKSHFPSSWVFVMIDLMECYFMLNRPFDCITIGTQLLTDPEVELTLYERGHVFLWMAKAEAYEGMLELAETHLEAAYGAFWQGGSKTLAIHCQLERILIACQRGEVEAATAILKEIDAQGQVKTGSFYRMYSSLVAGEVAFHAHNDLASRRHFRACLRYVRHYQFVVQQYRAHLRLGELEERTGHSSKARRHYQAALMTLARIQHGLTLTLGPDFLSTRQEAFHRLMRLELQDGRIPQAFALLEASKGYVFLDYQQRVEQLQWRETNPSSPVLEQLALYRAEASRLSRVAEAEREEVGIQRLGWLNRQIRLLTDQLYLHVKQDGSPTRPESPSLEAVYATLPSGTAMAIYYDDGSQLGVFVLTEATIEFIALDIDHIYLVTLLDKIRENHQTTIGHFLPDDGLMRLQTRKIKRCYAELGERLVAPVLAKAPHATRWILVPYGLLHHLPFHLLRIENDYLIARTEVVILPSAMLPVHRRMVQGTGFHWIGYSQQGTLPHAVEEVHRLHERWGGTLSVEANATSHTLHRASAKIMHLSTHGVHATDRYFDDSYLRMADRDVYSDDLLHGELRHELVTLSACETGKVKVAPGDDLIGLGRALLYAGAGAVLLSLWRVREEITAQWMDCFYEQLMQGADKAAAYRHATCTLLAQQPDMHPAFWGGFQLIGNSSALFKVRLKKPLGVAEYPSITKQRVVENRTLININKELS